MFNVQFRNLMLNFADEKYNPHTFFNYEFDFCQ